LRPSPKKLIDGQTLFHAILQRLNFDPALYAVFEIWDRVLGPQSTRARAVGLKSGRLLVEVDSHARLHDLTLRKRGLLKKINGHFGVGTGLSDIIFRLTTARKEPETGN